MKIKVYLTIQEPKNFSKYPNIHRAIYQYVTQLFILYRCTFISFNPILPPHQFSPHGASNGLLMIPPKTFDVYGAKKKKKLGPWAQFQNCYKMSNITRYRIFKEIEVCPTKCAIAWSLFDQLTSILLQMKAEDYI